MDQQLLALLDGEALTEEQIVRAMRATPREIKMSLTRLVNCRRVHEDEHGRYWTVEDWRAMEGRAR